jgi:hypothetical protein
MPLAREGGRRLCRLPIPTGGRAHRALSFHCPRRLPPRPLCPSWPRHDETSEAGNPWRHHYHAHSSYRITMTTFLHTKVDAPAHPRTVVVMRRQTPDKGMGSGPGTGISKPRFRWLVRTSENSPPHARPSHPRDAMLCWSSPAFVSWSHRAIAARVHSTRPCTPLSFPPKCSPMSPLPMFLPLHPHAHRPR